MGHALGREARWNAQPAVDDGPAFRPDLPHPVRARHPILPRAALTSPDPASYGDMCQAPLRRHLFLRTVAAGEQKQTPLGRLLKAGETTSTAHPRCCFLLLSARKIQLPRLA